MLDYEWGNPSSIMLTDDEPNNTYDSDPNRPFFLHFSQSFNDHPGLLPTQYNPFNPQIFLQTQTHSGNPTHFNSLYDPCAYANSYPIEPGYMVIPKTEPAGGGGVADLTDRIGLNLGGRTYFSSEEDDFVNRLYRRTRPLEAGFVNAPKCQAEGCNADLTHAKHYHRRHKVCEFHSKASTVIAAGLTQRFCQQCSRFHLLTEFDNGKRSCRRRLADHNRRRRKSTQQPYQDQNKSHLTNTQNSSSESFARSPPDSGAQSSSSVTIGVSPPPPPPRRISSDCFRPYQSTTTTNTSSASTNSLFYV